MGATTAWPVRRVHDLRRSAFARRRPAELARELLQRLADDIEPAARERLYRDPGQPATATPGADAAGAAGLRRRRRCSSALRDPQALARALGEWLTEPKPQRLVRAPARRAALARGVRLDPRTRMLYDARHVFINGESFRAGGRDARLMRQLADRRRLARRRAWRG